VYRHRSWFLAWALRRPWQGIFQDASSRIVVELDSLREHPPEQW